MKIPHERNRCGAEVKPSRLKAEGIVFVKDGRSFLIYLLVRSEQVEIDVITL